MFVDAKMAVVVELIVNLTRPISLGVALIVAFTNVLLRSITGNPLMALFAVDKAVSAVLFTGCIRRSTMLLIV